MSAVEPGSMEEVNAAGEAGSNDVDAFHPALPIPAKDERVSVLAGLT